MEEFLCLGGHLSRYIQRSAVFQHGFQTTQLSECQNFCSVYISVFDFSSPLITYSFFQSSPISLQLRPLSFVLHISFINLFIFFLEHFRIRNISLPTSVCISVCFLSSVFPVHFPDILLHWCHLSILTKGCHESSISSNFLSV